MKRGATLLLRKKMAKGKRGLCKNIRNPDYEEMCKGVREDWRGWNRTAVDECRNTNNRCGGDWGRRRIDETFHGYSNVQAKIFREISDVESSMDGRMDR
jgi:hypothetical protein